MLRVWVPAAQGQVEKLSGMALLWQGCLAQPGMLFLALANFVIYGLKSALINWLPFYVQSHGFKALSAAPKLSIFEMGGLLGSLASGPLSDAYWRSRGADAPLVGCRLQVASVTVFAMLVPAVLLVVGAPGGKVSFVAMFCLGCGLYVAQALTALSGLELADGRAAGVSQGLLGWSAYTGAAAAGLPLGGLIQSSGWQAWRLILAVASMLVAALFLPLWRSPSNEQRQSRASPAQSLRGKASWSCELAGAEVRSRMRP